MPARRSFRADHRRGTGEGVAARSCASRRRHLGLWASGGLNEKFGDARARSKKRAEGGQPAWTPPVGLPDVYIAMGQTAENVVEAEGVTREEMDEFGARSQQLA